MSDSHCLTNQFLVAMPSLSAGSFDQSVTYLCEHSEKGALGLVINRPSELTLTDMLDHLEIDVGDLLKKHSPPVFWGGPVQPERGFVLHQPTGDWEASLTVNGDMSITTSKDILTAIAQGDGPEHYLVTLGYAGWGAGQLEAEILHNSWLNTPAEPDIIFQTPPKQRWAKAAQLIGIDVNLLSSDAGHA
jgi:putative transcriptional regulator